MPHPFLYIETVLFQTILFRISTQFSSIWSIDRTLSGFICLCLPPGRTWHMVNDPKVGLNLGLGEGTVGTSRGSNPAGLCWSSAHLVQCEPDEPSCTWTQTWVQARMPDYSLNWTTRVQCYTCWSMAVVRPPSQKTEGQVRTLLGGTTPGQRLTWEWWQ